MGFLRDTYYRIHNSIREYLYDLRIRLIIRELTRMNETIGREPVLTVSTKELTNMYKCMRTELKTSDLGKTFLWTFELSAGLLCGQIHLRLTKNRKIAYISDYVETCKSKR